MAVRCQTVCGQRARATCELKRAVELYSDTSLIRDNEELIKLDFADIHSTEEGCSTDAAGEEFDRRQEKAKTYMTGRPTIPVVLQPERVIHRSQNGTRSSDRPQVPVPSLRPGAGNVGTPSVPSTLARRGSLPRHGPWGAQALAQYGA